MIEGAVLKSQMLKEVWEVDLQQLSSISANSTRYRGISTPSRIVLRKEETFEL